MRNNNFLNLINFKVKLHRQRLFFLLKKVSDDEVLQLPSKIQYYKIK